MDEENINAMNYDMANPFIIFSVRYFINSFFIMNLAIHPWRRCWMQVKFTTSDKYWILIHKVQRVYLMNQNLNLILKLVQVFGFLNVMEGLYKGNRNITYIIEAVISSLYEQFRIIQMQRNFIIQYNCKPGLSHCNYIFVKRKP